MQVLLILLEGTFCLALELNHMLASLALKNSSRMNNYCNSQLYIIAMAIKKPNH